MQQLLVFHIREGLGLLEGAKRTHDGTRLLIKLDSVLSIGRRR
jgi:hypothetical protein